jgi:3-hydroxybutyryl-CoA dehydrogenase
MMAGNMAVIGGGTMGVGIAYRFVVSGWWVRLVDVEVAAAEAAVARVAAVLEGGVARERLTAGEAAEASARMQAVASIADLPEGLDLIVESVFEDPDVKRPVLAAAGDRFPDLLASNTSGISIDLLATDISRPERFAGMHFFNPVWAIHLVEVVRGTATSDDTIHDIEDVVTGLGMQSAVVNDSPGFASTRLGIALGLEAIRMVEEGVAAPEDIDRAMELGYRHPMGPLRTGDLVGLDVRLAIAEHLAAAYGDRFAPPQLLRDMVAQGRLGKKTGTGFYDWGDG